MAASNDGLEPRDLMAPDTDPTDEELAAAMATASDLIRQRKALSDASIAARLEEAARAPQEHRRAREREREGS